MSRRSPRKNQRKVKVKGGYVQGSIMAPIPFSVCAPLKTKKK